MTKRDLMWLFCGAWLCAFLFLFIAWWMDHKTGIKAIEVPTALTQTMEQVEQVAETHEQIKTATQLNEAVYIKKWASFEKRLKQLEIQLAAQTAMLDQYKGQQEVMVASKPAHPVPAPQLVQLAKEVGFSKVEVK